MELKHDLDACDYCLILLDIIRMCFRCIYSIREYHCVNTIVLFFWFSEQHICISIPWTSISASHMVKTHQLQTICRWKALASSKGEALCCWDALTLSNGETPPMRGTYPVKGRNTMPMRGTCHTMLMTGITSIFLRVLSIFTILVFQRFLPVSF